MEKEEGKGSGIITRLYKPLPLALQWHLVLPLNLVNPTMMGKRTIGNISFVYIWIGLQIILIINKADEMSKVLQVLVLHQVQPLQEVLWVPESKRTTMAKAHKHNDSGISLTSTSGTKNKIEQNRYNTKI